MSSKTSHLGFVFLEIFSCEGGIQSYVKDVLSAYVTQQQTPPAEVFVLRDSPENDNPFQGKKLFFHNFASAWPMVGRIRLALWLTWYLLRRRLDYVVCGHILLVPLVAMLCRIFRVPYTVMTYGKEVWHPLPPAQQRGLQNATSLWTISRYSRDQACQANQLNPQKVHLLPCVVDGHRFQPQPRSPELVAQYGLQNSRVLMTVARLWPGDIYKGVDVTIRALPAIAAAFSNVKYLVIGRGADQPRLAQLAAELGVSERVVFAGFVPNEALADHYRLADAYVMPSQEGFGIVYLEAMACGVPVLSGDADGSADPLQDGRMGWRVPHRDSQAVAQACIEILTGQDPRCHGEWLRQETLTHFGSDRLRQRLAELLQVRSPAPH